ncbi:membrane protein [Vibrio inusitatus NBRC 102082]|uniref:Ancillary SecYEG translocon subunit n=1 Tax=Vibrio inusitatus NBRC 102082 TaxID=1219070 RepID=A0A4Y3HQ99_9VIBR|nr:YfgM family protein [Vibrio inusitatus]GEA49225.1 membrane protein [Vibrio inusitatus NBRC 102082]
MELYDSEEQQVEAIKDWWKENGKAVILGAVIGLGGLFGWRYYQDSVVSGQEAASDAYGKTIQALQVQGLDATEQVQTFINDNADREYAVLAALQLSQAQVAAAQYKEALAQLEWAKANTKDGAIVPVITLRVARVKAETGDVDGAIADLSAMQVAGWEGRVAELKGDLLLRNGDSEGALTAYSEAQQAADASQTIQFKLDDLAK